MLQRTGGNACQGLPGGNSSPGTSLPRTGAPAALKPSTQVPAPAANPAEVQKVLGSPTNPGGAAGTAHRAVPHQLP